MANVQTFEVGEKKYSVRLPNAREREEGERIHNRVFSYALKSGGLLESQIMKAARDCGLWDDEKDADFKAIRQELAEKEEALDNGGIEVDEGKALALSIRELRTKLIIYNLMIEELRSESVSRKADLARVEFFVARCTLNESGGQVFKDLDDFYVRQNDEITTKAYATFNQLWYNYNEDTFKFPEDKFMEEYFKEDYGTAQQQKKEKKPFLRNGVPIPVNG